MIANGYSQRHSRLVLELLGHKELGACHGGQEAFAKAI